MEDDLYMDWHEMIFLMKQASKNIKQITAAQKDCRNQFGENCKEFNELVDAINNASWIQSNC